MRKTGCAAKGLRRGRGAFPAPSGPANLLSTPRAGGAKLAGPDPGAAMKQPFRNLLAALVVATALMPAAPAAGMDAYEVVPAYDDHPIVGPAHAKGLVIWNHGLQGTMTQYKFPPPFIVMGLAVRGWDVVKLNRNPTYENDWTNAGQRHVARLIEEAKGAEAKGYKRVILAGQSYGGAIALEAARTYPAYAVIAMAPGIGQIAIHGIPSDRNSDMIAQATYRQVADTVASRIVFVLPVDDEYERDVNRAPHVRELMAGKSTPYILVDTQVKGHLGGYTLAFAPYADCAMWFLNPDFAPHPGEFRCDHDEFAAFIAMLHFDLAGVAGTWAGYNANAGQILIVAERRAAAGTTVDLGVDQGIVGKGAARVERALPATSEGDALRVTISTSATITMHAQGNLLHLDFAPGANGPKLSASTRLSAELGRFPAGG